MKKIFVLIVLISIQMTTLFAQKVIKMEENNGVYKIGCSINGMKVKMFLDTGASSVSISSTLFDLLTDNGYLSNNDILGTSQSQTADGSVIDNTVVNLKDISIDGVHLKNIHATVVSGQNAPLLLGQTALKQLGSYTIDGDRLILNDIQGQLSDSQLNKLIEQAKYFIKNGSYSSAIQNLEKVDANSGLTSYGYFNLANSYFSNEDYQGCIDACKRWQRYEGEDKTKLGISECYVFLGESYYHLNEYEKSNNYFEQCTFYDKNDKERLAYDYKRIGLNYNLLGNYDRAIFNFSKSIDIYLSYKGRIKLDILAGMLKDEDLGYCFYLEAEAYRRLNESTKEDEYLTYAALLGDSTAIDRCREKEFDYKSYAASMLR